MNSGYSSYGKKIKHNETHTLTLWLSLLFFVIILFWSPFQRALFNGNTYDFERPIYLVIAWSMILLAFISFYFFNNWKLRTWTDVLSIVVWILPFTYTISLFQAGSAYYSSNMVYIQIVYAVFFLLGVYLTRVKFAYITILYSLLVVSLLIIWFGIFHWLGNGTFAYGSIKWLVTFNDAQTVYRDAVMEGPDGLRLTSVFQYANTYAAFLITMLISTLYLIISSKKWYTISFFGFMLVPILVSFMLTLSRGALVLLPITFLIIIFFLKIHKQILITIYSILTAIFTFIILAKVTSLGEQLHENFDSGLSLQGWGILLGSSIVLSSIVTWIQVFLDKRMESKLENFSIRKWSSLMIPGLAVVAGIIGAYLLLNTNVITRFLPETISNRIENINFAQNSVLERGTFYVDAIKVFKDYPLFGAGGGAWGALYEKYQNNPYISRQAHNFFLQYLVEVGLVGMVIFLLFLGSVFYLYIRQYIRNKSADRDLHFLFFIIVISLLIHSVIDFDLSYMFVGILLFLCLGGMISNVDDEPFRWKLDKPIINKLFPSALLVLSIVIFFVSVRLVSANGSFQEAIKTTHTSNDFNAIMTPLNEALKLHPHHPNYLLPTQAFPGKIGILLQVYNQTNDEKFYTEAQTLLDALKEREPFNRQVLAQQIYMYQLKGQLDQAAELAVAQIDNFSWDITLYQQAIDLRVQLGITAKQQNNSQAADTNWNGALEIYNRLLEKVKYLETLPKEQSQGRSFGVTNNIALSLSQIEFYKNNVTAAVNLIKPYVNDQFDIPVDPASAQTNRIAARWYLAYLQKQNTNDQALYDKLIATDPNELQQIQAILSASSGVK